ncbi:hypothetical protein J3T99_05525 [Acetobacteraceae bacterium B3987]|nr:hypothetical protein [Acetobacteraceae bacterium B3987]
MTGRKTPGSEPKKGTSTKTTTRRKAKVPGSGRKKGTPNKATAEIKELAREHGPAAIKALAQLLMSADSDTARIAAAKELLDRGYGKATATQEISGPGGTPLQGPVLVMETVPRGSKDDTAAKDASKDT